jgi:MCM OB domain
VHALPYYLDASCASVNASLICLGAGHNGKLLTVTGTVVRAQGVQLIEAYQALECVECKSLVRARVSVVDPKVVDVPEECPQEGCISTGFRRAEGSEHGYTNYQEVNVQVSASTAQLSATRAQADGPAARVTMHHINRLQTAAHKAVISCATHSCPWCRRAVVPARLHIYRRGFRYYCCMTWRTRARWEMQSRSQGCFRCSCKGLSPQVQALLACGSNVRAHTACVLRLPGLRLASAMLRWR